MSFIAGETLQPGDIVYLSGKSLLFKQRAEAKMNKATIQALHKSITHWNDICYGMEKNYFGTGGGCALCIQFSDCTNCPIDRSAKNCNLSGSQWNDYYEVNHGKRNLCTVDSADAAEAMLELLVSLLPDDFPVRERYKYEVYLSIPGGHHPGEWTINRLLEAKTGSTGITTDGRNAFPQAKYVWERFFGGPSEWLWPAVKPVLTTYEQAMGRNVHRAAFDWSRPVTKDGKCVTCGQVVKKKVTKRRTVTKYKVVMKGTKARFSPHDWEISGAYWLSVEDFNRKHQTLIASCIIPETAKEFDV